MENNSCSHSGDVPSNQKKRGDGTRCPDCGKNGQSVSSETIRNLVREDLISRIDRRDLLFCKTPTCSIVYFSPGGGSLFKKEDIRVRVGLKETEDPVWVCYCFDISKRQIREEIERTGKSHVSKRIRIEVESGNCECEIKNPSGRCCLGDVRALENESRKRLIPLP